MKTTFTATLAILLLSSCALFQREDDSEFRHYRRIASAVVRQDLVLGMGPGDVRAAWGTPYDVEAAGERGRGNERWIYLNGLSARGYRDMAEKRVVYFEGGQVIGWETLR